MGLQKIEESFCTTNVPGVLLEPVDGRRAESEKISDMMKTREPGQRVHGKCCQIWKQRIAV